MTTTARIIWQISASCTNECWYCLPKYRNNHDFKTTDEYLAVIDKLQNYGQRASIQKISWKFKGGEVLQFSNFNMILSKVKEKKSYVTVETSGGNSWFDVLAIADGIDKIILTHHHWQNISVVDYIIDLCKEKGKELNIIIPAIPGRVRENKDLVQSYIDSGIESKLQLLENSDGTAISNYSMLDLNIFYGRPDDWMPEEPPPAPPVWFDPSLSHGNPSYTGKPCWAGVDWLYIDSKGFAKGSECGGRDIGNVFWENWTPPDVAFPCSMMYCHNENDRKNIRIEI